MAIEFATVQTTRAGQRPVTFPPSELPKIRRLWNSRIDLRKIEDLAHRIAETPQGQLEPVIVRKGEGGDPDLVAGNRRLAAIEYINSNLDLFRSLYPHITGPLGLRAMVVSCTVREAVKINLAENLDKLSLSPMDKAHTVQSLENQGWEDKEIADALRCGTTYLPTLRSYLTLDEAAQKALHDGVLTGELAKAMVGLPEEEVRATVKEVSSGATTTAAATRKVNEKKRQRGQKVARTIKEVTDALGELAEEYDLAFDLECWLSGQSTLSLEDLIKIHNKQHHEEDARRCM